MTKYDNNSVGLQDRVVSCLNSTTRTRRLCPRLDQTYGQNSYMSTRDWTNRSISVENKGGGSGGVRPPKVWGTHAKL